MDGANVEIFDAVGEDNIFIFGMSTPEVQNLQKRGYDPQQYYNNNGEIHKLIDFANQVGIGGQFFHEVTSTIIHHDPYMVLADFEDYRRKQTEISNAYKDTENWNRMSLMNISGAGRFAADRAIRDYANNIWNAKPVFKK